MKKVNIWVLVLCFVFVFSSFASFAEVSSSGTDIEKAIVSTEADDDDDVDEEEQDIAEIDQAAGAEETVVDIAYEMQELEDLLKIDNFANIQLEQDTVVKSAYKFNRINKTNLCMSLLMIKRYLNSRENYYKSEFVKIRVIANYKKKRVAEKAILKLEQRFAMQIAIDKRIDAKLVEIKKYIAANYSSLSAKQKEIIKANLQTVLAQLIRHRQILVDLQSAIQKAKDALVQNTVVDKKKLIDKAKNLKQKADENKQIGNPKKENVNNRGPKNKKK
ncbi:MAG: hypothetical protein ACM3UU_08260 [Ignavibacteriales bacterium]